MILEGKKVVVTGGAGFIGSHLVDALIGKNARCLVIDDLSTGNINNINKSAYFVNSNINSPKTEATLKEYKPDYIFHLAYNTNVPASVKDPLIESDSLIGSIALIKWAHEMGGVKKFVFASSEFMYGNKAQIPYQESEACEPIAPYAISKYTIENYLEFYGTAFNLPYTVLRYATVYGPRQSRGALTDYIRKLSGGTQAEIWGTGSKTREYIYVADIVRASLAALNTPADLKKPVFNVGTGVEITLNELYGKIARNLNKEPQPIYLEDRPGEQFRCLLDSSKIKKYLGFEPATSFDIGLQTTIDYFLKSPC